MNDHASALVKHQGQQCPIESHCWQQIQVKCALPLAVVKYRESARRR
jgi:hypothetical protein